MAVMELCFFSQCLAKYARVTVLLPMEPTETPPANGFQTLWFLHGMTVNNKMMHGSAALDPLSDKYKLAVVMPDADLSFYVNMKYGADYFDYIADELPLYLRSFLPLSGRREDNFIAGVSMGGYGAFHIAMNCPENYAAAVSFAGPMDIGDIARTLTSDRLMAAKPLIASDPERFDEIAEEFSRENDIDTALIKTVVRQANPREHRTFQAMFGANPALDGTDRDIFTLAEKLAASKAPLRLFAYCGTEDFHYPNNIRFKRHAADCKLDYAFSEGPGKHSWEFWNPRMEESVRWMLGRLS